jgi:cbb3-type cytochrome oxidase cytochrome c subunit
VPARRSSKTELDAVIAYLQGLGTALKSGKSGAPAGPAEAPANSGS